MVVIVSLFLLGKITTKNKKYKSYLFILQDIIMTCVQPIGNFVNPVVACGEVYSQSEHVKVNCKYDFQLFINGCYSRTLIQHSFSDCVKMHVVANYSLYKDFTVLGLKMLPNLHVPFSIILISCPLYRD